MSKVKDMQAQTREISAKLRDSIVEKAEQIPPSDDRWATAILTLGASVVIEKGLDLLFGESDPRKDALQNANKKLDDLWAFI